MGIELHRKREWDILGIIASLLRWDGAPGTNALIALHSPGGRLWLVFCTRRKIAPQHRR